MKKYLFILLFSPLLFTNCSKEEPEIEIEKSCYSHWTNGYETKRYRGGTVSITDRRTNETCSYKAILSITYSHNKTFSASIGADVNSVFDLCGYGGSFGYIDECRTDYIFGERISFNTYRETIFIVKDSNSFEGSGEIFDTDNSGNEILVADLIFSVPF